MILTNELRACGYSDSPEKFRMRLIDNLEEAFPGRNIDHLVCTPTEALEYCNTIRAGVGNQGLSDAVILKALMNIRKRKDCPTGLRSGRGRRNLERELQELDCPVVAAAFKDLVGDCLADMYKSRTIDEIVCHPFEALELCKYVRTRAQCERLNEYLILSTLMNVRKSVGHG